MILHMTYGAALALVIFTVYRHAWIGRMLVALASLAAFLVAIGIGAGYWIGLLQ